MLELEKMRKVRVIAAKDDVEKVIRALYAFGDIEVRDCKVSELDGPLPSFQPVSEMLIRLRALEQPLRIPPYSGEPPAYTLEQARHHFRELKLEEADGLLRHVADVEAHRDKLQQRRAELLPFRGLRVSPGHLDSDALKFLYFSFKPGSQAKLKAAFKPFSHELLFVQEGKSAYALLAFDARAEEAATAALQPFAEAFFAFPAVDKSFPEAFRKAEAELAVAGVELDSAGKRLAAYGVRMGPRIAEVKAGLKHLAAQAELPFKFGRTQHFSVVEGWIQSRYVLDFQRAVGELKNAVVELPESSETPPSKLRNLAFFRPFEFLVEFFSLPMSYGLDPTLFVSLSFPLFFGMILGDVGYGLLTFFLALFLRSKFKNALGRSLSGMMALCAASTILFGFVYGEVFGLSELFGFHFYPLLARLESSGELISLSIALGVVHVGLGFLLGFLSQAREKHWKHALAKLSWLVILLSLVAIVLQVADISLFEVLTPLKFWIPSPYSFALFVAGLAGVAYFESPAGLIELPGLVGNVLSYLRIAALGIAAAVLALIINQSIKPDGMGVLAMFTGQRAFDIVPILLFVLAAVFLVVGNLAALVLGLMESSIQTLRLHYVEFFGKFYEGGGLPFKPLKPRRE